MQEDAQVAAEGALRAQRTLRDLAGTLDGAGIPWLLWKGPELAWRAWGDTARRHFSDLDLVVEPRDLPRALTALTGAGWSPRHGLSPRQSFAIHRSARALPLERPGDPLVELHWAFGADRFPAPLAPSAVIGRATTMAFPSATVRVPSAEDALLLLALHASKHGWSQAEEAVTWARLAAADPRALAVAEATAQRAGVASVIGIARALAAQLAGLPANVEDAETEAASQCIDRMRAGDGAWRETHRWSLTWVRGPRARARYLSRALFAPTPEEWKWIRLPDALLWAYPGVRILRLGLRTLGLARR